MLYVVATPIGNLGDITLRAIEVLKSADIVAAEDTRRSGMLLKHLGIKKPFISYHEHNEATRTPELVERLEHGEDVAVITDAGMPGLSDRGCASFANASSANSRLRSSPGPHQSSRLFLLRDFRPRNFLSVDFSR